MSEWKVYSPVTGQMPPESTPVMGYNPSWVDEDFNPRGIRECFRTGDGTEWINARWTDGCDTYETDEGPPTHYYEIPDLEATPQSDTVVVEREVTHYVAVDPETQEVEIFQSIAASGGSHDIAKDQVHQRINEFVMGGYEGAERWLVRGATVHGLLTLGEG